MRTLELETYPKQYEENMLYRAKILDAAEKDVEYREAVRLECKHSAHFFFNTFLYTYDPRVSPYTLPFITYPYEDTEIIDFIIERIHGQRDGLLDKTRDMGVTWSILGTFYHQWLFEDGFLSHLGSKTEDDVDRTGDMKSLFEKLRFFIKTTPRWLLPQSYEIRFMRIVNNDNSNSITGESANLYFSRQGRYKAIFYDEFASTEYANEIWTAMGDSTPSRIVASTPNGTGNKFWSLRFKELDPKDIKSLHWSLHPRKALGLYMDEKNKAHSPWYDAECTRRSPVEIAQELDIDYLASGNPYFDLKKVTAQREWTPGDICGDGKYELGILAKVDGKVTFRPGKNGNVRVYEYPTKITQATIGCDPAEGLEHGDKTAIVVRDKRNGNLLAAVYGQVAPDAAGVLEELLSLYYNGALSAAEMGGYGLVINQYLWDRGCNVFRDVNTREGGEKEGKKLGFNTKRHRAEMLKLAEEEIRNEAVEIRDRDIKVEMLNFINKDGKPQAAQGSCDDFIFAWAIAGMLAYWYPYSKKIEQSAIGYQKSIYGSQQEHRNNMGFGFNAEPKSRRRF